MKTNWKTNLSGAAVLILLGLYLSSIISTEQFLTATAFLVSIGLFSAQDGKKKTERIIGGSTPPVNKDEK